MRKPRQATMYLPRARLELAYPLTVSGPDPEGAVALAELHDEHAPHVCRAIRAVLAYCRGPVVAAPMFQSGALAAWEAELLAEQFDEALWNPLFVIVGELQKPDRLDLSAVAWSCLLVAEWAQERGATGTAIALMEAAGTLWPEHPRYAWMIGRMLRTHGRTREAYLWLTRAARVGFRQRDWEVQTMALNSLGNLCLQQGSFEAARSWLQRALAGARRHGLLEREAGVLHDLFVLSVMVGDLQAAEDFSIRAFARYRPAHPNVLKLAHDVVYSWCKQGHFTRALPVLAALLPHFHEPDERLRILATMVRAAGGSRNEPAFTRAWTEAQALLAHERAVPVAAESLVEMAFGAASMRLWTEARRAVERALDIAADRNEHETAARADCILAKVAQEEPADLPARPAGHAGHPADQLAIGFVGSLEALLACRSVSPTGRASSGAPN